MDEQRIFEPVFQQHQKALLLGAVLARGVSASAAAIVVGVSRSTAYRWLRLYQRGNEWDLLDKRYGPETQMTGVRKPRGEKEKSDAD